jgi:hypothetical protein
MAPLGEIALINAYWIEPGRKNKQVQLMAKDLKLKVAQRVLV